MTQVEDEYELVRGGHVYQLSVEYDWAYFPPDDEGCPIVPKGAPMTVVEHAWVMAEWEDGSEDGSETRYGPIDYPELEPPLTEQEQKDFDEHLADKACASWEDRG